MIFCWRTVLSVQMMGAEVDGCEGRMVLMISVGWQVHRRRSDLTLKKEL